MAIFSGVSQPAHSSPTAPAPRARWVVLIWVTAFCGLLIGFLLRQFTGLDYAFYAVLVGLLATVLGVGTSNAFTPVEFVALWRRSVMALRR